MLLQTIPNDVPILNVDLIIHLLRDGNPKNVGIIPLIFTDKLNHYAEINLSSKPYTILTHILTLVEKTKSPEKRQRFEFDEFDLYAIELMKVINDSKPTGKTEKDLLKDLHIYDRLIILAHTKLWLKIPFEIIEDERRKKKNRKKQKP